MKTLFVLRHAKSSWDNPGLSDFDRPLNKRGLHPAPMMGKVLRKRGAKLDLAVSSPAERALQTARLVLESHGSDVELKLDPRIYEAGKETLLQVVKSFPSDAGVVLLVGHNPGMEDLIELLTGEVQRMPTAALAKITFDVLTWEEAEKRKGKLAWVARPKDL